MEIFVVWWTVVTTVKKTELREKVGRTIVSRRRTVNNSACGRLKFAGLIGHINPGIEYAPITSKEVN